MVGELKPYRSAEVYAGETGFVDRVLVDAGAEVRQGEVLAVLFIDLDREVEIRAPFAGVVQRVLVHTGVRVGPGMRQHEMPLFEVAETARLRLVATVPSALEPGTRIRFAGGEGTLERVVERAGTRLAEIAVDNAAGRFKPGSRVEIYWPAIRGQAT